MTVVRVDGPRTNVRVETERGITKVQGPSINRVALQGPNYQVVRVSSSGRPLGKGFINHGGDSLVDRPAGFESVEWFGSVQPLNAIDGDTWVNVA